MADNTLNFDLDAPAVPTLTLDPTPAAVPQEEKPAAAPAPEAQVNLTPEEQAMVDQFAQKIDITNSQQVLQYGSACQRRSAISPRLRSPRCPPRIWARWAI